MSRYKFVRPKTVGAHAPPRATRYGMKAGDDAYVLVSDGVELRTARLRIVERTSHDGKTVYLGEPDEPWLFGRKTSVRFQPLHVVSENPFPDEAASAWHAQAADGVVDEPVGTGGVLIGLGFLAAGVLLATRG